jgi:hypothetical protein
VFTLEWKDYIILDSEWIFPLVFLLPTMPFVSFLSRLRLDYDMCSYELEPCMFVRLAMVQSPILILAPSPNKSNL